MSKATRKKESGLHDLGKDNSAAASRRDDHPSKRAERAKHEELRKDQQITADTNTVFPKRSTADKKAKK